VPAAKQVQKVRELKEQNADGRRKSSAPAKSKKSDRSSAAAATKKGVNTKQNDDEAESKAKAAPPANASTDDAEDDGDDAETNAETNAARSANGSTDVDQSAAKEDSPPVVPEDDGLDLPAALRRTDDEKQYEDFEARWEQYCGAAFAALPAAMQSKFASELLGKAVIATAKKETRH
jgi:hypothetical protein